MRNLGLGCGGCGESTPYPDYTFSAYTYDKVSGEYCWDDSNLCANELTEAEYNGLKQWMESLVNLTGEGEVKSLRQHPDLPEGIDFGMLRPKLEQN